MMAKTAHTAAILVVFLLGCSGPDTSDSDATTVHGALLAHLASDVLLVRQMSHVSYAFSADPIPPDFPKELGRTWREMERGQVHGALEDLRPETWDAFVSANEAEQDLSRVVHFSGRVVYVTQEEIDGDLGGNLDEGYKRLFKRHTGTRALTAMSMPGISPNGAQALLYVETMRGGLAGLGRYYLLIRENGTWRIVREFRAWIA